MKDKICRLFLSQKGKAISESIFRAMKEYGMTAPVENGSLVGFSGGPDSVMLLSFLAYFSNFGEKFPVVALHVNHCIRGDEADRDEAFAKSFCDLLNIELVVRKVDVPAIASKTKKGIEECARECRYFEFANIISGRSDLGTVCVAHNADDNLETVILNMLRGSGTRGMAGIPPVRDNIVRPLLYVTKSDIVEALCEFDIGYVFDSTNSENDYKRNFIRNNVIPQLRKISASAESMAVRSSRNLRTDDDYISSVAKEFLESRDIVKNYELSALHDAVFLRVLQMMANTTLCSAVIGDIRQRLCSNNFSYSLAEGKAFVCEYGKCFVRENYNEQFFDYTRKLCLGVNHFDELGSDVFVSIGVPNNFSNVYNFSIQVNLASAIIEGDLYLRPKKDGDTVRYGGMTHKLKKLFNDRKIPPSVRALLPVFCDDRGVVFVPGFGVRDDNVSEANRKNVFVALCIGRDGILKEPRFHSGNEVYK